MSKKSVFSLQFIIKFFRNFLNAKNRRSLDPINVQEICGKSNMKINFLCGSVRSLRSASDADSSRFDAEMLSETRAFVISSAAVLRSLNPNTPTVSDVLSLLFLRHKILSHIPHIPCEQLSYEDTILDDWCRH